MRCSRSAWEMLLPLHFLGAALGSPPRWMCWENLLGDISKRQPYQMPQPPQLNPFTAKVQWFYASSLQISELLTPSLRLSQWSYPFVQQPRFMAKGEVWLNRELHLKAQLPSHHDSPEQCPRYCRQSTNSTVDFLLQPALWTRPQVTRTSSLVAVVFLWVHFEMSA